MQNLDPIPLPNMFQFDERYGMATAAVDVPNNASHMQCLFGAADTEDIR